MAGRSVTDEDANRPHSSADLVDSAPAILWTANAPTFQFTFVSSYAETLLGWSPQHWAEPSFWKEHTYPEDSEWVVARRAQAIKAGGDYEVEYRLVADDGRVVWVRELGRVLARDNGTELVGVIVDLSQKRSSQEALAEGKHWLRQVIDTIPVEIWSGPADGTLDFWNARWRNELGLTLEELDGDGWQKMIHSDDRDRVLKAWHKSVAHGTPYQQQERHRMATGEYRWFLCRAVPLRDEHGKILRWFGSSTDIDDRKRAEDALRDSEQRWRGVFDNTKVGIALLDSSFHYVTVNAAYETMVGYRMDELRSLTCVDLALEEDRAAYKAVVDELVSGKRDHFELEKRYRRKNGELVWVRVNGSVVAEGGPRYWVIIAEDITERRRLHDQLARERDRLRLLLDLNNTFVSKLDIRDFFTALADSLRKVEGWVYSAILLPEPAGNRLQIYLNVGGKGRLKEGMSVPIEGTVSGKAFESGKPVVFRFHDLPPAPAGHPKSAQWRELARAEGLGVGCVLPLIHAGRTLGVLSLATRNDLESARADLGFLQELANLVAIALNNALRYVALSESHEKLINQRGYIEDQLRADFSFGTIIGESAGLRGVLQQVDAVAPTDSTVLILGETGTGKELIARAIHDRSPRRGKSFIKVDCSAIPGSLMESELFGHEKGAFTGAITQKLGRFESADGGTLFLDEIGDVPLELQTKLLRVLQDGAFERLGSNRTRKLDVRIVTATNRDLESMVKNGEFREDLYYRLKVFPIEIPPLRDRPEDIPLLVRHYVAKYAQRMKKRIDIIPARAMDLFTRYPWPGNVRELQHFIERSVILSHGKVLQAPLVGFEQTILKRSLAVTRRPATRTMEEIERESIREALRESNWVVGGPNGAAAKLGLKRTTLASRIEKLGISRERQ